MVQLIEKLPNLDKKNDVLDWVVFGLGAAMLAIAVIGTAVPTSETVVEDAVITTETAVF